MLLWSACKNSHAYLQQGGTLRDMDANEAVLVHLSISNAPYGPYPSFDLVILRAFAFLDCVNPLRLTAAALNLGGLLGTDLQRQVGFQRVAAMDQKSGTSEVVSILRSGVVR
eukprot:2412497-Amphidinium_carterae.1